MENRKIKEKIKIIYEEHNGWYGYRRITLALQNEGIRINHKTVLRLMRELNLKGKSRRKQYRSYRGSYNCHTPNIIQRNFFVSKPNKKWFTDISLIHLPCGKLYLSPILDGYNGEIISLSLSTKANMKQIHQMLEKAYLRLSTKDRPILHSDQGWQYQQKSYLYALYLHHITPSMSQKGNCYDNAIMENFFGTLKKELLFGNEKSFSTIKELADSIEAYVDYYNNHRIKLRLGMPPIPYRLEQNSI